MVIVFDKDRLLVLFGRVILEGWWGRNSIRIVEEVVIVGIGV